MYLSADDARSDFFLAAAVYVIGPTLITLLIDAVPQLFANRAGLWFLLVIVPVLTTAAMPLFLLRYREQSFAVLFGGGVRALLTGLAVAGVLIVTTLVGEVVGGGQPQQLGSLLTPRSVLGLASRWGSLAVLAVFLHTRAEYAFRPISERQAVLVRQAGVAAVGTAAVTTVLLLLDGRPLASVVAAAGLVAMYGLAERLLPQQGVGERWWVWAPVITLALGPVRLFSLFLGGASFLASAQQGAVVALFGLVVVMAMHNRRGGLLAFGLATGFALVNLLTFAGGTGFIV
ncbi:MAG TPA: hypothetical protein VMM13_12340 [Euzebya sp.]|nr:hypothetical protein [Euzebya sp.]